ncbi:uncharacterized protein LODBEIA_P01310 [Lodderomyces beijingensis]|uniref:Vacuolar protein sorting-associated protein 35 n=1 Tax=Lodderomyces beijingensis TaxID=1775926 RepID=A0ABP0ZCK3_9ASCO
MVLTAKEQDAILQSCISDIKQQSNLMKKDLDENKLLPALKHCSNLLNELRANQLTPKQYYEMYMMVFDALEILSGYLLSSYNAKMKKKSKSDDSAANGSGSSKGSPKSQKVNNNTTSAFLADLYEIVQYSGNIIPRLYMMIVIGTTYMNTKGAPTKDLMKDMTEMCHGVQYPIRGLFLRYYLSQRTKNLLPYETRADFNETVDFLIANFIEMNKLWVRLQHQGHSSEREIRYREREELKILVGSNLVRLSEIMDNYKDTTEEAEAEAGAETEASSGFSQIEFYKEKVFPTIVEQIIQCRDHLAQTYLIDVLIQIFPDEFHFATLDTLLNQVFLSLHPTLNKSELVSALIEKFISYNKFAEDASTEVEEEKGEEEEEEEEEGEVNGDTGGARARVDFGKLIDIFWNFYMKLNEVDPNLSPAEHSSLLQSFIKLSLTFDPGNFKILDTIYKFGSEQLIKDPEQSVEQQEMLLHLLLESVCHFKNIKTILTFQNFFTFYEKLNPSSQHEISIALIDNILQVHAGDYFSSINEIDEIFKFMTVLTKQSIGKLDTAKDLGVTRTFKINNGEKLITPDYLETQEKVCKLIQIVDDPSDLPKSIANLIYLRKKYLNKNFESIIYTYPTLLSKLLYKLKLLGYSKLRIRDQQSRAKLDRLLISNFKNLSVIIDELYQVHHEYSSELILNLYLNAASVADQLQLSSIAFELFNQCFVVYEENLHISAHQYKPYSETSAYDSLASGSVAYQSITALANALVTTRNLSRENYDDLITRLTLSGSKLSKKQDQCRAVYSCAHLWWWTEFLLSPGEKSPTVVQENRGKEKGEHTVEDKGEDKGEEKGKDKGEEKGEDESALLYRDPKRVLECLQRSLKIADSSMDPYLTLKLFIEILNECLFYNIHGNAMVDSRYINGLISLVRTNMDNLKEEGDGDFDNDQDSKEARLWNHCQLFFNQTIKYVTEQQESEDRFAGVFA